MHLSCVKGENNSDTDDNSDLKGALKSPYLTAGTNQVDYKSNILP